MISGYAMVNSITHKANLYITSEVFSESVKVSLVIKLKYSKLSFFNHKITWELIWYLFLDCWTHFYMYMGMNCVCGNICVYIDVMDS